MIKMDSLDPVEESRRLQEHYARLSDDELQAAADEGYDLTDLAKEALQAEIRGRGLHIQPKSAPAQLEPDPVTGDFDASDLDLVVVSRVWDLTEALLLKSILDDARVPSYLGPDDIEKDTFRGSFNRGVDLKVRYVDNQRALQAISQSLPPDSEVETDYVPRCTKCHSSEIVFQSLDSASAANSAFDSTFNWSCDACGHRWKDDGIEEEA
jgi:DNA-directed RNA polymerase subunit M/transcription elongation factor TFIIS